MGGFPKTQNPKIGDRIAKGSVMARVPLTVETPNSFKLVINAESAGLTPDQFFRLCGDNPDLRLELTARKEIIIMPPFDSESGRRNLKILQQLGSWADTDGTGYAFCTDSGFTLPNGAVRGPDAAWIRRETWEELSREKREKFAPVCPDFVIELRSPSDSVSELQEKMREYIANGASLGWLIDPFDCCVFIYRPGLEPERLERPLSVSGDPPLPGFVLNLPDILQDR